MSGIYGFKCMKRRYTNSTGAVTTRKRWLTLGYSMFYRIRFTGVYFSRARVNHLHVITKRQERLSSFTGSRYLNLLLSCLREVYVVENFFNDIKLSVFSNANSRPLVLSLDLIIRVYYQQLWDKVTLYLDEIWYDMILIGLNHYNIRLKFFERRPFSIIPINYVSNNNFKFIFNRNSSSRTSWRSAIPQRESELSNTDSSNYFVKLNHSATVSTGNEFLLLWLDRDWKISW